MIINIMIIKKENVNNNNSNNKDNINNNGNSKNSSNCLGTLQNSSQSKALLHYTFGAFGGSPWAQMALGYR